MAAGRAGNSSAASCAIWKRSARRPCSAITPAASPPQSGFTWACGRAGCRASNPWRAPAFRAWLREKHATDEALRRLLASPHIDAVCSPVSYLDRSAGGGGFFMAAVDSVKLHGKLWIVEDDTRTHLSTSEPGLADLRETAGLHARNFARGDGAWWMDLYGQGWLKDEAIWRHLGKLGDFYQKSMDRLEPCRPEIAVIVDERSSLGMSPGGAVERLNLPIFRTKCYQIGTPAGVYLLDDLVAGKVPPAKMTLILNASRIDAAQLEALRKNTMRKDTTTVWMYAPSYVRDDVTDPAATPLATYSNGTGVAVASKTTAGHTSVYCGVLQLPAKMTLILNAGVHLYNDQNDVVMAGNGLVALHASAAGKKVIKLPRESAVEDVLTGEKFPAAAEFTFEMQTGDTRLLQLIPAP